MTAKYLIDEMIFRPLKGTIAKLLGQLSTALPAVNFLATSLANSLATCHGLDAT
jgi:hypothetical protein